MGVKDSDFWLKVNSARKILITDTHFWLKVNNVNYSPFDNSPEYFYLCAHCGFVSEKPTEFCPACGINNRGIKNAYVV